MFNIVEEKKAPIKNHSMNKASTKIKVHVELDEYCINALRDIASYFDKPVDTTLRVVIRFIIIRLDGLANAVGDYSNIGDDKNIGKKIGSRKDRVYWTQKKLKDRLDQYCILTGIKFSRLVRAAIHYTYNDDWWSFETIFDYLYEEDTHEA